MGFRFSLEPNMWRVPQGSTAASNPTRGDGVWPIGQPGAIRHNGTQGHDGMPCRDNGGNRGVVWRRMDRPAGVGVQCLGARGLSVENHFTDL
jgi:hypothetical protein